MPQALYSSNFGEPWYFFYCPPLPPTSGGRPREGQNLWILHMLISKFRVEWIADRPTYRSSRVLRRCRRRVCRLDTVWRRTPSTSDDRTVLQTRPGRCTSTEHVSFRVVDDGPSAGVPSADVVYLSAFSDGVDVVVFVCVFAAAAEDDGDVSYLLVFLSSVFGAVFVDAFFCRVTSTASFVCVFSFCVVFDFAVERHDGSDRRASIRDVRRDLTA